MEINFCGRCGAPLEQVNAEMYRCEHGHQNFLNPSPTASIVLLDGSDILLSQRAVDPNKGMFDCFGGFMITGESVEEAAAREIREETGLGPEDYSTPVYFGSYASTYAYGGEEHPIVSMYFYAYLKPGRTVVPGDDSLAVQRMALGRIDWSSLSGDDTVKALRGLEQLLQR